MDFNILDPSDYFINPLAIPSLITSISVLILGVVVLRREQASAISRSFFGVALCISIWLFAFSIMYCAMSQRTGLLWARFAYAGVPFLPAAAYTFSVSVTASFSRRKPVVGTIWAISAVFSVLAVFSDSLIEGLYIYWWGYYPRYGWLSGPFMVFFFSTMAASLYEYWRAYRESPRGRRRQRIFSFLVAFSIAYLGSVDYFAKFGVEIYPAGYIPVFIFLTVVARTMIRYRLVDLTPSFAANEIVATMPNPLIVCDREGIVRVVNEAAQTLFGYSRQELIGSSIERLANPLGSSSRVLLDLAGKQAVRDHEMKMYASDGKAIDVSLSASSLFDQDHMPAGSVFVVTDIREIKRAQEVLRIAHDVLETKVAERTAELARANNQLQEEIAWRKRIESELRAEKEKLQKYLEVAGVMMLVIGRDETVTLINRKGCEILEYPERDIIGKNWFDHFLPEGSRTDVKKLFQDFVHGRADMPEYHENPILTRSGDEKMIAWHNTVLRDEDGNMIATLSSGEDITERKKLDIMKSEFISTVSHELKTPLTSVRSALDLIADGSAGVVSSKAKYLVDMASRSCQRLVRLVNDILDTQRIEAGKIEFVLKPVELKSLVEQAVEANQIYANRYESQIVFDQKTARVMVRGDADRLVQVLNNLLSNAAKFSPPHSKIHVSVTSTNRTARVAVKDFGPGIPDEFQSRIFQKFSQSDVSKQMRRGGTGLGLWISRAIIEKLGGSIGYESAGETGTTFYFDLPVWIEEQGQSRQPSIHREGQANILICEDERDVAYLFSMLLADAGFSTAIAYNAAEAKRMLLDDSYQVLMLDLGLPDQDGISLVRELRQTEHGRELPIVVVSAKARQVLRDLDGDTMGIADWIEKPVDPQHLAAAIREAAGKANSKTEIRNPK